ncbi:UDP-N-acetylglucosamine--N-acetylmuramyl-(pentapeptide) pyrophosphoryl-undecaprenol N-acetylglucosamine transferase [Chlamydiia bacterium]|nr:UDP-N-acetylglucosamine--N-acetylmuramyl-(pentapeptide) pyrophosphoryl-undecaprenol N-acetylglucosamine transferase [Chlamydiia bacterium]
MKNTKKDKKNIIFAVGGTGGHIFPAVVIADKLTKKNKQKQAYFVGSGLSKNPFINTLDVEYKEVKSSTLTFGVTMIVQLFTILFGFIQSFRLMKQLNPSMVVGFGSYHSVPVVLAAVVRRIPIVLYESNVVPGRTNSFFARYAKLILIQFAKAKDRLKSRNVFEIGLPTRMDLNEVKYTKKEARKQYKLDQDVFTLLIMGGSQGSREINVKSKEALKLLSEKNIKFQVIHLTGRVRGVSETKRFYDSIGVKAVVRTFEENMQLAWSAADFCISRSGGVTVGEMVKMAVPGILIPYPDAKDDHQSKNADFIAEDVGGAIKLLSHFASPEMMLKIIADIVHKNKLKSFKTNLQRYYKGIRKYDLHDLVNELVTEEKSEV